jgi:hypothetical protein
MHLFPATSDGRVSPSRFHTPKCKHKLCQAARQKAWLRLRPNGQIWPDLINPDLLLDEPSFNGSNAAMDALPFFTADIGAVF